MPRQRNFDQILLITVLIIMGIGIVMIYNTSALVAVKKYGCSPYHFLIRHFFHLLIALCILFITMKSPYILWKKWSPVLLIISLILLVLVLIIGVKTGGARRWIKIAPFLSFQPSELAKISLIIFMASYLAKKSENKEDFVPISAPLLIILTIFFTMIVAQPDLGTGVLIILVGLSMLFVAGMPLKHILVPSLCFLLCVALLIWLSPYRLVRITSFLNPWYDPKGSGYQLIRSFITIGSGGKIGRGLGNSTQACLTIPEPFTDFIFAIIAKEVGLIGAGLIVCLFFLVVWRGLKIACDCEDSFGQYLATGITCLIGFQGFINMGVVTGLLPTKGIALPFISYGGSSLVFSALGVGILLNVSQYASGH